MLYCSCTAHREAIPSDTERRGFSQGPQSNAKEWTMKDRKSDRAKDDRMRKLTEGDGGSWVNLSSKSSQSRPIHICTTPGIFFPMTLSAAVSEKKRWGQIIYDWRWPLSKHNLWARSQSSNHCYTTGDHIDEKDDGSASNTPLLLTLIRCFEHCPEFLTFSASWILGVFLRSQTHKNLTCITLTHTQIFKYSKQIYWSHFSINFMSCLYARAT